MFAYGRGFGPEIAMGRGLWFVGSLIAVAALAALIGLIVWLVLRNRRPTGDDPMRMAAARYAAGRISREEFERNRTDLQAPISAAAGPADPETPSN